jgi:hypothetical protein
MDMKGMNMGMGGDKPPKVVTPKPVKKPVKKPKKGF